MSEKLRSVNTRFWEDPFIEDLSPSEKLLFLYLLTNPLTNLLGIYELTIKRMAYDTGLSRDCIQKALESFQKARKVLVIDNYVILPNFLKNQSLNDNMKIGVIKLFKSLPDTLKENLLGNDYLTLQNDYLALRNGLLKLNGKGIEIEEEIEEEDSKANDSKDCFEVFRVAYPGTKRGLDKEFENFTKKHSNWKEIIPILNDKLNYQISARETNRIAGGFVPEWKNLQTWINQSCWEEEISVATTEQQSKKIGPGSHDIKNQDFIKKLSDV